MLELKKVKKTFDTKTGPLTVLDEIDFNIAQGTSFSIVGPSGSGKTTLLGLCAGLDQPTNGEVLIDGVSIGPLSEDDRAKIRSEKVGFVFQNFQLIPSLTALENVMVPLELQGAKGAENRAKELLETGGIR